MLQEARALLHPQFGRVSNMANLAALLFHSLPDINWAGFYIMDGSLLRLGPFQGKVACTQSPPGRGVCGAAAAQNKTIVVPDVHAFAGHIACDGASRSEIVIPLADGQSVWGVLDIDSPVLNRFDQTDQQGLERLAALLQSPSPDKNTEKIL